MKESFVNIEDENVREAIKHIFREGQGKVIELESAPTTADPKLLANEWGVYSNVLYHRVGDTILTFTPSSTISI